MSKLTDEQRRKIKEVFPLTGGLIRATAREVGVSRNAVRRVLRRLGAAVLTRAPRATHRKSKLDPYKAKIKFLAEEKHLSAVRILEEIRAIGYTGGYSILKDHLRLVRPRAAKRPRPPIDHRPAHEAQMDWSPHRVTIGGRETLVHTGSIVLAYSRWLFFRHFRDQTLESVIRLHKEAFHELGSVPHTMTYDNMTTVGRHIDGKIWINPTFQRVADEYGFEIIILPPGAKERHGAVERPFHYIENNFLAGRDFVDLDDLNRRADLWRHSQANVRRHGTLRERPVDRLERERPFLKPLPRDLSDTFFREVERLIHTDFCVAIDANRYSASPRFIGRWAKVRLYREHLEIWVDDQLDCRHLYREGRNGREVLPEHEEVYKTMTGQRQLLEEAFLRLGEKAKDYYEELKGAKGGAAGYHMSRILKYADRYGVQTVLAALAQAHRFGAYSADAVLRIIQGRRLRQKGSRRLTTCAVPEHIRQHLSALAVETTEAKHYDRLVDTLGGQPQDSNDNP